MGVGGEKWGHEASRVEENPRGYYQGVGWGVQLPQSIDTPGVTELSWGDKNPRVTTEGEGVPGEKGRGWGGDGHTPTTQATEAQGAGGGNGKRMGGPRMLAPPRPQQVTKAETDRMGTLPRHTAGTDGARPEHGALACRKYGLLALTGTAVNPANARGRGVQTAMRPQKGRPARPGGRQRRGAETVSKRSQRMAYKESIKRDGYPLNGRARLICVATKGEKQGVGDPPSSTHPRSADMEQGGGIRHGSARP